MGNNISELALNMYKSDHHGQTINENYYSYSAGETTLPKSTDLTSLYVWLENNTTKDIIIYPGQVTALTTSPSADIYFKIERFENSTVDTTGITKLTSFNLGDLYTPVSKGLDVYPVPAGNVTVEGDEVAPLRSFVIGKEVANEEERGERYKLKAGQKILAKITNLVDKDLNVYIRSFWSFV